MAANPQPLRNYVMRFEDLTDKTFGHLIAIQRIDAVRNVNLLTAMERLDYVRIDHARLMRKLSSPGAARLPRGEGGRLLPSPTTAALDTSRKNRASVLWLCLCSCGKPAIVQAEKLKSGHTRSCGCLHTYQGPRSDLRGKVLGDRTVIGWNRERKRWEVRCNKCGAIKLFSTGWLNSGRWGNCAHCSPGRVERGKKLQAKRWRPGDWKNWPEDEKAVATMLIENPEIRNREIGIRLDDSRFPCPFGRDWETSLTQPGSGATWIHRVRNRLALSRQRAS